MPSPRRDVQARVHVARARLAEHAGDRAVDRPDELPRALPDRACRRVALGDAQLLGDLRRLRLHRLEVLLQLVAVVAHLAQRRGLARARLRVPDPRADELALDRGDLVAPRLHRRRDLLLPGLELREVRLGLDGVRARTAHEQDDLAVLVGDPADELGALEEVGEVGRPEDDGEDVGLVGLEELHEARREHRAGLAQAALEPDEAGALGAQLAAEALELGPLGVEVALEDLLAAGERRDPPLEAVDPARVLRDVARQRPLRALLAADPVAGSVDLPVQLVELALGRRCGGRPEGQGRPEGDGDRDAHDEDDETAHRRPRQATGHPRRCPTGALRGRELAQEPFRMP